MAGKTEKLDGGKRRMDLLPWPALVAVADVMTFGARKYEDRGYYGMEVMRLFGANQRHLASWVMREDVDQETGLPHVAHAAANSLMILELQMGALGIDDRPDYGPQAVARPARTR